MFSILSSRQFSQIYVKHVSTSINRGFSRETLRNSTKSVNWVDERTFTESSNGIHIKLNFRNHFKSRSLKERVISVQSYSMSQEIKGIILESVFLLELLENHSRLVFLISLWLLFVELLNEFEEFLASSFLE